MSVATENSGENQAPARKATARLAGDLPQAP